MNYGEVLSRAWQTIWKHKALWIFGILAGCTNASSGPGNISYSFERNEVPPQLQVYIDQFQNIPAWQIAALVVAALLVVLVLTVLAVFLSTMGRIGMIRGTQQVDKGEAHISFGDLWRGSLPYFWRVFLLNLLIGLVVAVIGFVVAITIIASTVFTLGLALLCLWPLICLLIPISWLVTVLIEQANIAIVVENLGVMDGLKRGWEVFRNNLGTMIVMGLILSVGVTLIGGFIIGLPVVLIILPALSGALVNTQNAIGGGLIISGLCFVAYLPVLILLNGILTGYIKSAWTLTYLRISAPPKALEVVTEPVSSEPSDI